MSKGSIKYKIALGEDGSLIDIAKVDKKRKLKYTCPNPACKGELIPRKGRKKAHHFAHKVENCSYESYLHATAKIKFYNTYTNCLENGVPFYLEYQVEKICNTCRNLENLPNSCKLAMETKHLDLTQYFTKIFLEKNKDKFIADILLATNNEDECILVEFAVTHRCEENKIRSGLRIIEFQIENEGQLDFIETLQITEKEDFCHFFNINPNKKERSFFSLESCSLNFETFIIYRTGKAIKKKKSALEIANQIKLSNYLYIQNLDLTGESEKNFRSLVEESSQIGIEVRNCFACRFFAYNTNFDQIHPYWCNKHRAEIENSNDGVGCSNFWRISKINEPENTSSFQTTIENLKEPMELQKAKKETSNSTVFQLLIILK